MPRQRLVRPGCRGYSLGLGLHLHILAHGKPICEIPRVAIRIKEKKKKGESVCQPTKTLLFLIKQHLSKNSK